MLRYIHDPSYIQHLADNLNTSWAWYDIKSMLRNQKLKAEFLAVAGLEIKRAMIERKLCLDEFKHDPDWQVRYELVKAKYDLEYFFNDSNRKVRNTAIETMVSCITDEVFWNNDWNMAKEFIKKGYAKELINYSTLDFKLKMVDKKMCLNELANCTNLEIKFRMIDIGYKLDKLAKDESVEVRLLLAKKKYCHDKLIKDKEWQVREIVARKGDRKYLKELANDPDWHVRYEVARRGVCTRKLINDENAAVKAAALEVYDRRKIKAEKTNPSYITTHEYRYSDPAETRQDYISSYNYDGYSEEYYNYN